MRTAILLTTLISLCTYGADQVANETGSELINVDADSIVVEQTFDAPVATVWSAITEQAEMVKWFFEPIAEFEPRAGFETRFMVVAEDQEFLHLWTVIEAVPQSRIVYDWSYGGHPGSSTVTWELSETVDGTTLRLTHSGIESFPQDVSAFSREAGVAGWKYFIHESLKAYLEQ